MDAQWSPSEVAGACVDFYESDESEDDGAGPAFPFDAFPEEE